MEDRNGNIIPKIKISENDEKITNPGFKKLVRIFDKTSHMAIADVLALNNENYSNLDKIELFDPIHTWKRKKVTNFYTKDLLTPIFEKGKLVYESPSVLEIKDFAEKETNKLWPEVLRFENPHTYYVDLSKDLWELKNNLLLKHSSSY